MVLKLECASELPKELVQTAGPHPQSIRISRSELGLGSCISQFPGDANFAGPATTL